MKRALFQFIRGFAVALVIAIAGVLAISAFAGIVFAQPDTPVADCGSGPNVICPRVDDPAGQYIASVTAVPDGVVILLTDAGLEQARACGGAAQIAAMAALLYASIPEDQRAEFQLDWTSPALADEIYGHAFFNELSAGVPGLGSIQERSNPINIAFADYGGPGEMTPEARVEQETYAALGAVHRAACG